MIKGGAVAIFNKSLLCKGESGYRPLGRGGKYLAARQVLQVLVGIPNPIVARSLVEAEYSDIIFGLVQIEVLAKEGGITEARRGYRGVARAMLHVFLMVAHHGDVWLKVT